MMIRLPLAWSCVHLGLLLLALVGVLPVQAQNPGWSVDPAAYSNSMGVVAQVQLDGVSLSDPQDHVAAFVGADLRGVAQGSVIGGSMVFFLTVYGDTAGETITFQIYRAATDAVHLLDTSLTFAADTVVGATRTPFVLHAGTAPGSPPAWSVDAGAFAISMNLVGLLFFDGMSAPDSQTRVAAFVGDDVRGVADPMVVEGQALFFLTIYGVAEGEFITLKAYDPSTNTERTLAQTYAFAADALVGSLARPEMWTVGGSLGLNNPNWTVNPAAFPETMTILATVYVDGQRLGSPDDRLAVLNGHTVQGVAAPRYVDGVPLYFLTVHGGLGDTFTLQIYDARTDVVRPLDQTLSFEANAARGSLNTPLVWTATTTMPLNTPTWTINPAGFAGTMSVVAAVFHDGRRLQHPNDQLAVFAGDDLRGVATPLFVEGQALFFLTLYGNTAGEGLTFRAYDAAQDIVHDLAQTSTFTDTRSLGSVVQPTVLNTGTAAVLSVDLKVYLAGAFDGTSAMRTDLAAAGVLPHAQPYAAAAFDGTALDYDGTERVDAVPTNAVDWVLVELRTGTAASTTVARRAVLLLADGSLYDTNAAPAVAFTGVNAEPYYVVVRHRNHLSAMTSTAISLASGTPATYDFTTAQTRAFGEQPMQELAAGIFGLYAGDGNASGGTTASDQAIWLSNNGFNGYLAGDYNLSGGITASDQAAWLQTNGFNSQVPDP